MSSSAINGKLPGLGRRLNKPALPEPALAAPPELKPVTPADATTAVPAGEEKAAPLRKPANPVVEDKPAALSTSKSTPNTTVTPERLEETVAQAAEPLQSILEVPPPAPVVQKKVVTAQAVVAKATAAGRSVAAPPVVPKVTAPAMARAVVQNTKPAAPARQRPVASASVVTKASAAKPQVPVDTVKVPPPELPAPSILPPAFVAEITAPPVQPKPPVAKPVSPAKAANLPAAKPVPEVAAVRPVPPPPPPAPVPVVQKAPVTPPPVAAEAVMQVPQQDDSLPVLDDALLELEAALEADLSIFAPLSRGEKVVPEEPRHSSRELSFPDIQMGISRPVAVAVQAAERDEFVDANGQGSNLLASLRQQAEAKLRDSRGDQARQQSYASRADVALRRVFHYCNDLVQQLNVLCPPVQHQYLLAGTELIRDLFWQNGFADYRTQVKSAGALLESVSLSFHALARRVLEVERENEVAERFRRALYDANLVFTQREVRNDRGNYIQRVHFSVPVDVRAAVLWQPDEASQGLKLEIRHVQRFGVREFIVPVEFFDSVCLDEFTCFLLGEPNQFLRRVQEQGRAL